MPLDIIRFSEASILAIPTDSINQTEAVFLESVIPYTSSTPEIVKA
ncbi:MULTISPECIES: hypothetical protein [unclassified Dysgonomonas]|nr:MULTISPECIES: hypothetical protein [unclassified Dysgonomonas]HMM03734.1 hypothetical protein [Dysgonomonas sp.]